MTTSATTQRPCTSSADALLEILNDILDFSKIEAGSVELEELDFDLRALLDDFATLPAVARPRQGAGVHLRRRPRRAAVSQR